jgi:hypothetical protein
MEQSPTFRRMPKLRRALLDGYGAQEGDELQLFLMTKALQVLARGGAEGWRQRRALKRLLSA